MPDSVIHNRPEPCTCGKEIGLSAELMASKFLKDGGIIMIVVGQFGEKGMLPMHFDVATVVRRNTTPMYATGVTAMIQGAILTAVDQLFIKIRDTLDLMA